MVFTRAGDFSLVKPSVVLPVDVIFPHSHGASVAVSLLIFYFILMFLPP